MIKYTHKENESALRVITAQAVEARLLRRDERLNYEKGGRGTATVIRVQKLHGNTWMNQLRPTWVPEFGYKDGPSVVGNALTILSNTLYSINALPHEPSGPIG